MHPKFSHTAFIARDDAFTLALAGCLLFHLLISPSSVFTSQFTLGFSPLQWKCGGRWRESGGDLVVGAGSEGGKVDRMEAVVDIKYRPALYRHGGSGGVVGPTKKLGSGSPTAAAIDPAAAGVYLECLRNHAASAGGHVVDGCGEFMPAAPAAPLRCAACGCHRSFHRRVAGAAEAPPPLALLPPPSTVVVKAAPPHLLLLRGAEEDHRGAAADGDETEDSDCCDGDGHRPMSPLPAPALPPSFYLSPALPPPHTLFPLPATTITAPASSTPAPTTAAAAAYSWSPPPPPVPVPVPGAPLATPRKRFRSKFTAEQKRRMRELSERVGWRLRRRDAVLVADACRDIGVARGVFKVWMHNNKHSFVVAARRPAAVQLLQQPCSHTAVSAPPTPPPPVLRADEFNINGPAADYYAVQQPA